MPSGGERPDGAAGPQGAGPSGPQGAGASGTGPSAGGPVPPGAGPFGGPGPSGPPPRFRSSSTASFFDSLRRTGIWRGEDRWIGGVAAGIARRLDVDPLLVRGVLVVMTLFGGLGLLLYGLGWALLPEESDGRIHLQEALHGNVDAALAGAAAFVVVGLSRPGTWWGDWWWWGDGFFWSLVSLATVALVVVVIVALARRGSHRPPRPTPDWSGPAGFAGPSPAGTGRPAGAPQPGWAGTPPQPGWVGNTPPEGAGPSVSAAAPDTARPRTAAQPTTPPPAAPRPGEQPADWRSTGGPVWSGGAGAAPAAPGAPRGPRGPVSGGQGPFGPGGPYPVAQPPVPPRPVTPGPGQAVVAVAQPPVPPRPVTPGPGQAVVAVVLALCLIAVAALLLLDRVNGIGWQLPLLIGGVVLGLLGLGVLLSGARGRRGGALSVLGILLALLVVPATAATTALPVNLHFGPGARVGTMAVAPHTVEEAAGGYDLAAGNLELDLRQLPAGSALTVPVDVGAGDITIRVPAGSAVRVEAQVGAGSVESRTGPGWSSDTTGSVFTEDNGSRVHKTWANGLGLDTALSSPEAQTGSPDIVVKVDAGAGRVYVIEDVPAATTPQPTEAPSGAGTGEPTGSATTGAAALVGPGATTVQNKEEQR
ncbi:PspC domain-containing protein, partial [Georgenia ruanii]|nr:PspC domain-containing protein [Georgenia ruanii]